MVKPIRTDRPGSAAREAAHAFDLASVEAAVAVAIRAPSIYNTQPWRWRFGPSGLDLRADRSRQLAVADPDGHSLLISCGAALALAEYGLRAAGWTVTITRLPDPADPDLLARLRPHSRVQPTQLDLDRVTAARHRHSDRRPYRADPVPPQIIGQLRDAATEPGVYPHFPIREDEYIKLAVAVSHADRFERHNADFAAELANWVRPDATSPDGVPVTAVPHVSAGHPRHTDIALRDFEQATPGVQFIELDVDERPLLAVVLTGTFGPPAYLQGGQAMMRLMIEAHLQGLATCAISQAVDLLAFRARLRATMGWTDYPQMMLRIGIPPTGAPPPPTPRRPVTEVLSVEDIDGPTQGGAAMADETGRPRLDFSATDGAELVERLEEASCGPRVKALMVDAVHACNRGVGPTEWHAKIIADYGAGVATLLDEAEECMQASGLWPW